MAEWTETFEILPYIAQYTYFEVNFGERLMNRVVEQATKFRIERRMRRHSESEPAHRPSNERTIFEQTMLLASAKSFSSQQGRISDITRKT